MAKTKPNHLKLYTEQVCQPPVPETTLRTLPAVLEAFRQATGWSLQYCPAPADSQPPADAQAPAERRPPACSTSVDEAPQAAVGHLVLSRAKNLPATADLEKIRPLTTALSSMLGEMLQLQEALWRREAELAAGVPLVPARDEQQHLAHRLEAVLKGGAEAVGCQAAGLYLLDEGTSELKLRSCWGLPRQRLLAPARPLRGAMADLEAMLGHAVVLDEAVLMKHWAAPEQFAAAVCVPIATATTILGTLWVFASEHRAFDDRQTNILEVVAGRLASDLEREMLLHEGIEGARLKRQLNAAQRVQQDHVPQVAPDVDGWDLWGWNSTTQALGGHFYDWFCQPDDSVAAVLGHAAGRPIEAAITAAALRTAFRSHGQYHSAPEAVLAQASRTLWTMSAGDQHAAACYAACQADSGRVRLSMAGPQAVFLLDRDGVRNLAWESPRLGEDPAVVPECRDVTLEPGQTLIAISLDSPPQDAQGRPILDTDRIGAKLTPHYAGNAHDLADLVRGYLQETVPAKDEQQMAVLIVKHRAAAGSKKRR